jgi:hypothetical protein
MTGVVSIVSFSGVCPGLTGDAQVRLASSVHDDAQADGGCSLMLDSVRRGGSQSSPVCGLRSAQETLP